MKPIKLSEAIKQDALARFKNLVDGYTGDGDLTLKITLDSLISNIDNITKPIVYVTATAFLQMQLLISKSSKELAWHGTVERVGDNYIIKRILVYPQTVTSVTVDADEEAYAKWIMNLNDDTLNSLRFQGHSHVNMGVSPSGRDSDNWQKFLNLLTKDDFYIFCIGNKKGEFHWSIYDMSKNIIFENKDITMCVIDEAGSALVNWAEDEIKTHIKDTTPAYPNCQTSMFGQQYQTVTQSSIRDTRQAITKKFNSNTFKEFVPIELQSLGVCYEPEFDLYYSDTYVKGFVYSNTWGCFIMEGEELRELRNIKTKPTKKNKKGPGRPKKGVN